MSVLKPVDPQTAAQIICHDAFRSLLTSAEGADTFTAVKVDLQRKFQILAANCEPDIAAENLSRHFFLRDPRIFGGFMQERNIPQEKLLLQLLLENGIDVTMPTSTDPHLTRERLLHREIGKSVQSWINQ